MSDKSPEALRPGVSVVVPVFNSENSLVPLCERLGAVLGDRAPGFEVILVNDASRDASWERIRELAARHPFVRGIDLMRNFGQHNALLCGIRAARHEFVLTLDDDLQHPPEEVPRLIEEQEKSGADVVYGSPQKEQHGLLRDLASVVTKMALRGAMGVAIARRVSAFRYFRTRLREAFEDYGGSFVSIDVLLSWGTTSFAAIDVRHEPREIGTSNYTVRKLVRHALNMVTGFSIRPLQLASLMGFFFALFGVLVLAFIIVAWFVADRRVEGFAFLASIIAIFSGAQLLALGIIGEYLARVHFRIMDRPTYVRRAETGERPPAD